MRSPNVLYVHSQDTGRLVSPYGYAAPTPTIQKLAEEGVVFRQAFTTAPTCSPSRASFLTGQYAHSCGQFGLVNRGFELRDIGKHLVHTLHQAGYSSALIGLQHIRRDAADIGYQEVADVETLQVNDVVPSVLEYLDRPPSTPFFLSVGFAETHREE